MKIELWYDATDWTIGVSWWRRRYAVYGLDITFNLLIVKIEVQFRRLS